MRTATDLLVQYARVHRDRRNIVTHLVGIPLIVFSIGILLARPPIDLGGLTLTPAMLLWVAVSIWYLSRRHVVLAAATSALNGLLIALAHPIGATGSVTRWLGLGLGTFVVGWIIQFVGHIYEGRRPAFVDDLVGLLVGPMFVAYEGLAVLGRLQHLHATIERQAGPTHLRDLTRTV